MPLASGQAQATSECETDGVCSIPCGSAPAFALAQTMALTQIPGGHLFGEHHKTTSLVFSLKLKMRCGHKSSLRSREAFQGPHPLAVGSKLVPKKAFTGHGKRPRVSRFGVMSGRTQRGNFLLRISRIAAQPPLDRLH